MTVNTNRGKITAKPEVLNYIALIAQDAADKYKEEGFINTSAYAKSFSLEIRRALALSGYYNEL